MLFTLSFNRNLSGNPLLNLQTLTSKSFPRLTILDVSGLSDWLSIDQVQKSMRLLQVIRGTPLDKKCFRCFFSKPFNGTEKCYVNDLSDVTDVVMETSNAVAKPWVRNGACYGREVHFTDKYFKQMRNAGFTIRCTLPKWCQHVEHARAIRSFIEHKMLKTRKTNRCWRKMNDFSVGVIFLALIGIVLDSLVFLVTMYSKQLCEKAASFLVAIIAVGDLLASVYLFIITITRASVSYEKMVDLVTTVYCTVVGTLFFTSQGVSVLTAFFMTVERYLSIVYCLSPDIRLRLDSAKKCMAFTFVISFIMALLPYTVLSQYYASSSHCMPNAVRSEYIEYLAILGSISSLLYLSAIPLYFRMYLSIRRSSQDLAIQRERKVQKKILLIVMTNMIFFALPFVCFGIIHSTPLRKLIPQESIEIFFKTFMYYCFAVSACLNPMLFSFRNDKFMVNLKRLLRISPSSRINPPLPHQQNT